MDSNSVIVTMYFNLRELQDVSKATRPIEFYLKTGRGTLQLDYPMIIFCDVVTLPLIKQIRDELIGENNKTIYLVKPLAEYELYKLNWPIIQRYRQRKNRNPEDRNTTSYYLTCMFKILALKIAHERNDFNASHYFWIDFGCSHIAHKNTMKLDAIRMLESPRPKVGALYIRHWSKGELKNLESTVESGSCGMAGTVFSVQKQYVERLYSAMMAIFFEMMTKEIGHTDEQVMTVCCHKYPELFSLYFGDYYSVISNYHEVINDWHCVKTAFIIPAIQDGDMMLANQAITALVNSYESGHLDIPHYEITAVTTLLK